MIFKRILAAALAAAALLSFSSCGFIILNDLSAVRNGDGGGKEGEAAAEAAPSVTQFTKYQSRGDLKARSEAALDALPERDWEDAVFFITTPDRSYISPEETGDVLSRLAVQRNAEVEDRFHVTLLTSVDDASSMLDAMKQAAASDSFYTDLLLVPFYRIGDYKAADLLLNMRSAPFFDLGQPYFIAESSQMTSGGYTTYAVAGDASVSPDDFAAVFVNKTVLSDAGVNPFALYTAVDAGTWTWDRLLSVTASVHANTDAATVSASSVSERFPDLVFKAMGNNYILTDNRRVPLVGYTANSAKNTMETLYALYSDDRSRLRDAPDALEQFADGNCAFHVEYLAVMPSLVEVKADWGLLPLPKGSESQEAYKTLVANDTQIFAIPKNHTNCEIPAVILSALNAASWGYMYDSYVEYNLMNVMRDNDSVNMLDFILDTPSFDFAIAFGNAFPTVADATYRLVRSAAPENNLAAEFSVRRSDANRTLRENFDLNY